MTPTKTMKVLATRLPAEQITPCAPSPSPPGHGRDRAAPCRPRIRKERDPPLGRQPSTGGVSRAATRPADNRLKAAPQATQLIAPEGWPSPLATRGASHQMSQLWRVPDYRRRLWVHDVRLEISDPLHKRLSCR